MMRVISHKKARPRQQQGVAAVEFIIVIPLLALLMVATAEFGRMLYQYTAVVKTTRDGARFAAKESLDAAGVVNLNQVMPFHPFSVQRETQNLVVYGNRDGTGPPLLPGFEIKDVLLSTPDGVHIEIRVDYLYQPILGSSLAMFGLGDPIDISIPLVTTVKMRAH